MDTRVCSNCKQVKPLTEYNWKSRTKNIRHYVCRICWNESNKQRYRDNKQYYVDKAARRNKVVRGEVYEQMIGYLQSHPCIDCGEDDPVVLTFDHIKGCKSYNISDMVQRGYSWNGVAQEIEKCVVRCFNCHMRRTAIANDWKSVRLCYENAPITQPG